MYVHDTLMLGSTDIRPNLYGHVSNPQVNVTSNIQVTHGSNRDNQGNMSINQNQPIAHGTNATSTKQNPLGGYPAAQQYTPQSQEYKQQIPQLNFTNRLLHNYNTNLK